MVSIMTTTRFRNGQRVTIEGDKGIGAFGRASLEPIPADESVTVFEDYGQTHITVMRNNGQLRTVPRASVRS